MIRLLSVGDQHCDSVPPSSRKDDYWASLQAKFIEIRELARERQANAVIWLGDMFHKQDAHRVPYFVTNWLLDYFDRSLWPGTDNLVVQGNHDVKANVANWRRQPIGTLVAADVIVPLWEDASEQNPLGDATFGLTDEDHSTAVSVGGRLFSYDADLPHNRPFHYAKTKPPPNFSGQTFHIQAIHNALIPVGDKVFGHYSNINDVFDAVLPDQRPDLYVCGHLHEDYGVFEHNGLRCMNLGSLSRGSIDEYNLTRKVKVGYIEVSTNGAGYRVKLDGIVLKCVKPAEDVFLVDAFQRQKQRSAELEALAMMLSAESISNEFKLLNPDDALALILDKQEVRQPVRKLLSELIAQTKQEMG